MESDDNFVRDFCDACYDGYLSKVQKAITSGRLTPEIADEGLSLATDQSHFEIVAALFDAGIKLSPSAVGPLPREHGLQDISIVRQFLDHRLGPNSGYKKGWPILGYVVYQTPAPLKLGPKEWRVSQARNRFFPDLACARELLSRGANPNLCNDNGEPILSMVILSARVADASLIKLFLE
jgi:hypothetical protein